MSLFDVKELLYPFIAHVNLGDKKYPHYVVIYKSGKNKLVVGDPDPSVRVKKVKKTDFASEWTGVAIFLAPAPSYRPSKDRKNGLLDLLPLILKQKWLLFQIISASLLVTVINIVGSYYLQLILDEYVPNYMFSTLGIISVGLIVTYSIQQIMNFAKQYLLQVLNQRLTIDVILSYIRHIFELPMSFFATRRTGEITSRFSDANSIIDALASTILSLFLDFSIVLLVGGFLLLQNISLFLISLVILPFYILFVMLFLRPFERLNQESMQANAIVGSSIIKDITGIETIKALTSEEIRYQKIDSEFVDYLDKSFRLGRAQILQFALKEVVELILNVVVLWFGAQMVMRGELSIGQLVSFNVLLAYLTTPLENLVKLQTKLQAAQVANRRLNEVYLVDSEFTHDNLQFDLDLAGDIAVENLSFKYGYGHNTLSNITMTIKKNEKVSFVGVSGSGKTTLAKMFVNFYQPNEGTIRLNGQELKFIDKQALRRHINYLPQQPYIFNGTILDNLTLGMHENYRHSDILKACEIAEIRKDIEEMPLGFRTELSDGAGLSGGQKQRLVLARVLLTGAPVLILDEATSSLDVLTEKKVINNLLKLKEKTIIFVAHRLTIAELSDRIILLENGKVMEVGSHSELLSRKGRYFTLHSH